MSRTALLETPDTPLEKFESDDVRRGRVFLLFPGTSCQAAFADYGAPDSQGFAQPPLRSRRRLLRSRATLVLIPPG
jgi:hypothetical protein